MNQWVNEFDATSIPIFKHRCVICIDVQLHRYGSSGWETDVGALEEGGGSVHQCLINMLALIP
jgi:hypothetical protein